MALMIAGCQDRPAASRDKDVRIAPTPEVQPTPKKKRDPAKPSRLEPVPYDNAEHLFSVNMPQGWKEIASDKKTVVSYQDQGTGTNILIKCLPAPNGATVDMIFKGVLEGVPKVANTSQAVADGDVTIGGMPGKWIEVKNSENKPPIRQLVYVVVKNPRCYMVFCTAGETRFKEERPLFEEVIESLELR